MPSPVRKGVPLAPCTTLGVGGDAEYFADVTDAEALIGVLVWAEKEKLPVTILGEGSNVLIDDSGIPGVVICVKFSGIAYDEESPESVLVTAGGGEDWDTFVDEVVARGLWGLENLSGIPGTVGAAPIQNVNAYGTSVGDVIVSVSGYHRITGAAFTFSREECRFGYRDSIFKSEEGKAYIVTSVSMRLAKAGAVHTEYRSSSQSIARYLRDRGVETPAPADIREAVLHARKNIGMLRGMFRSAGSFFKNTIVSKDNFARIERIVSERHAGKGAALAPWHWDLSDGNVKVSTAFLMECTPYNKTDFDGKTWNGVVGISPLHTLSIVNVGSATAKDVRDFSDEIINAVEKEFHVRIEPEVCMIP